MDVPSTRALSQAGARPSGRDIDEVDSDNVEAINSGETLVIDVTKVLEAESDVESHPSEGMLIKNPKSSVKTNDVKLWRYMYKIPQVWRSGCRLPMRE